MKRRALILASIAALTAACSKKKDDGTSPVAAGSLPALTIRDDTPELMLTWIDDKGDTHVALHPPEIPEAGAGRSLVRVVIADREAGTRDMFYVADLTKKKDDGAYDTRAVRRREWEDEIEKRRDAYLTKLAPPPKANPSSAAPTDTPPPPADDKGGFTVVIYGASWCGPCHDAEAYLKKKGVAHVMKDIESTPGANAEMQAKLKQSGHRGGSIPVIDVRGQILVGYDPRSLDRALAKAAAGTTL